MSLKLILIILDIHDMSGTITLGPGTTAVRPFGKSLLRPFSLYKDSSSGSIVTTDTSLALKILETNITYKCPKCKYFSVLNP